MEVLWKSVYEFNEHSNLWPLVLDFWEIMKVQDSLVSLRGQQI